MNLGNQTRFRRITLLLIINLILIGTTQFAEATYEVKVIYFKTREAKEIDHDKYEGIFREIQNFFRDEMSRHGYGEKTINYETDKDNLVKVHSVTGEHNGEYYSGNTFRAFYDKISKEIPFEINSATNYHAQEHHYIIILAGVPLRDDGSGNGYIGNAWTFAGNSAGGTSICNAQYELGHQGKHYKSLIIHELAHTFGLKHTGLEDELMGPLPHEFPKYMTKENAAILDKHRAFYVIPAVKHTTIDADVNDDGYIDLYDVLIVRSGMQNPISYDTDVNNDGITDEVDLLIVKAKAMEAIAAASPRKRKIKLTTWGAMKRE